MNNTGDNKLKTYIFLFFLLAVVIGILFGVSHMLSLSYSSFSVNMPLYNRNLPVRIVFVNNFDKSGILKGEMTRKVLLKIRKLHPFIVVFTGQTALNREHLKDFLVFINRLKRFVGCRTIIIPDKSIYRVFSKDTTEFNTYDLFALKLKESGADVLENNIEEIDKGLFLYGIVDKDSIIRDTSFYNSTILVVSERRPYISRDCRFPVALGYNIKCSGERSIRNIRVKASGVSVILLSVY